MREKKEYRFIRLGDRFGFEEILPHVLREHKNLAQSTKLFEGRTPGGELIVTDGGRMIAYADHVELAIDWTGSTQVKAMMGFNYSQPNVEEAYDLIQRAIRTETAQKLADLLHMPVVMKYQSVVRESRIQEFTFLAS
jgi:hypothetical protein